MLTQGTENVLPPPIQQDVARRRAVTLAFWAVALLGLPYWYHSTSIERLTLPTSEIASWTAKAPCFLSPELTLATSSFPTDNVKDMAQNLRDELDRLPTTQCLHIRVTENGQQSNASSYELRLVSGADAPTIYGQRTAHVSAHLQSRDDLRGRVLDTAKTLLDLKLGEADPRVAKFAPKYKLVFSLLNQDATTGAPLLEWDIHALLQKHLKPLLTSLEPLHSFEIETQVQYFAPLSIEVKMSEEGTFVEEADLRAFVNSAEWNLAAPLSLEPVLHFIVFVPSRQNRPMRIHTTRPASNSPDAFISPQWGGVVIYNPPPTTSLSPLSPAQQDLSIAFLLFQQHLHLLLGVPPAPESVHSAQNAALYQWQVDAMVRRRVGEAARETVETLDAIVKLTREIPNMRVGKEVQKGVRAALSELEAARIVLPSSPEKALAHLSTALSLASKAYYNPTMLALLYFPDEHKYAVYTPLHGPIAVPLLVALVREWREWKKGRRRKKEKEEKEGQKEKEE